MYMVRVMVLLALMEILTGCGGKLDITGFESYVSKFEQKSREVGKPVDVDNLVIRFNKPEENIQDDSEDHVLARCYTTLFDTPTIVVNKDFWVHHLFEDEREELMMHEMGHCVLGRQHEKAKDSHGMPISIMNPFIFSGTWYTQHNSEYIKELFKDVGKQPNINTPQIPIVGPITNTNH